METIMGVLIGLFPFNFSFLKFSFFMKVQDFDVSFSSFFCFFSFFSFLSSPCVDSLGWLFLQVIQL